MSRRASRPRAPTDREWERLVSEFRTTFGTQVHTTTSGGLREWSQGSLHISIEPTEHGEQLLLAPLFSLEVGRTAALRSGEGIGAGDLAPFVRTLVSP